MASKQPKNILSINASYVFLLKILISGIGVFCYSNLFSSELNVIKNVILFVSDDHGMDALGCYGNPVVQTPHMDELARSGVRFSQAYCTSASCAASRSVILTGKFGHATASYGHVHDYHHFSTFEGVLSLPVLLSTHGIHTARIGKYHVAPEEVYHFEEVLYADPRNTVEMAESCEGVIRGPAPFFLYFCPDDPHRGSPFSPEQWWEPNPFGNRPDGYPGVESTQYDPGEVQVPDFLPDTQACREEIAQYYQSINRIDQGLGKLIQLLKDAGKWGNTAIIYISDNGMAFPGAKTTVYEPGIKLPCIVRVPGEDNMGGINHAMISWVDLTPTILELMGIKFDEQSFHGRSFAGIIGQESPKGWYEVFASHTFHEITMYYPMRVCRKENLKLIWNIAWRLEYPFASDLWASSTWQSVYRNHGEYLGKRSIQDYMFRKEFELYDLSKDPGELQNLAYDPGYQQSLNHMIEELKAFQKRTGDPWLIMWDHDSSLQGTGVNL